MIIAAEGRESWSPSTKGGYPSGERTDNGDDVVTNEIVGRIQ